MENEVIIQDLQRVCATYQYKLKKCQSEFWNVTNLSNYLGKINIIERKNWKGYYQKNTVKRNGFNI